MPIPRHLKHPIALWIIDSRKAMTPAMKPADIARAIDVTEATVRAWETVRAGETKRLPSADNVDAMARLFGQAAPGREPAANVGQAALIVALTRQADAIEALTIRLDLLLFGRRTQASSELEAAMDEVHRIVNEPEPPPTSGEAGLVEGARRVQEPPGLQVPERRSRSPRRRPLDAGAGRG
jgi:hypothetical protein